MRIGRPPLPGSHDIAGKQFGGFLKDNFGVGANVTSDDFNKVVTEEVDGKTVVK